MRLKFTTLLAMLSVLNVASSALAQINIPTNLLVRAPLTTKGGTLRGEYWKRPTYSIPTDGASNSTNRIDNLVNGFGPAEGTFTATQFTYLGNDLSHITNWLGTDAKTFKGTTNNLDDGVIRLTGFINVTNAGTPIKLGTTSDDGSRITIGGIDVINNDNSHGDATVETNVVFAAAGVYPVEITYFNGDWTDDGTGDKLNHSGNPDPAHHGGANFHLLVNSKNATNETAAIFYADAGAIVIPQTLKVGAASTKAGTGLNGEYWKRPINSIPTDGASNPTNRIDELVNSFGTPSGTFQAKQLVYLGNDLAHVTNWLAGDAKSFVGTTNNLDDGAFRLRGYINVTNDATTLKLGTASDDGSRITIGGIDIVNNDGSHGDATVDTNVFFAAAGLYPIEITYFNGDWTDDGTGDKLNHSGNPDPAHHGGANFHLRVGSADVTTNTAGLFFNSGPAALVPAKLAVAPPSATTPSTSSGGRSLFGEYWQRPTYSIPTDGATNPKNRIDSAINSFGPPTGNFQATKFVYLGNDLTPVRTWLGSDASSFSGTPGNFDDGAVRLSGVLNITAPGTLKIGTTSDDGSRITIGGMDIINNDSGHGDATIDTNVVFAAAGLYPIEITYFNGDWTDDGTGSNLNHSGNPDPAHHGGANFHLRIAGNDVTATNASIFYTPTVPPPPPIIDFAFNEGEGPVTIDSVQGLAGIFGQALDAAHLPVLVTNTPSNGTNDLALSLNEGSTNGLAALVVDDRVNPVLNFRTNQAFTIETWINIDPTDTRTYEGLVAYGRTASSNVGYKLGLNNQGLLFTLFGVVDLPSGIFPTKGEWHHVASVWKPGTGVEFFLDGTSVTNVANTQFPRPYANNFLTIGAENVGTTNFATAFQGMMDRVRVHKAALTAAQLDSVAATPKPVTTNTVVAYDFNSSGQPFKNAATANRPAVSSPPNNWPTWTNNVPNGKSGDFALQFAANQHVEVPNPNNAVQLDTNNPSFTMQAWVNFKGNPTNRMVLYYNNGPGGALSFSVFTNRTVFVTTLGVKDQESNAKIPDDGNWHHVAVVHENKKEFRFYVDGALADTQAYTGSVIFTRTNQVFYIGSEPTFGLQYVGMLDRLMVTKGTLTPEELDYPSGGTPPSLMSVGVLDGGVGIVFDRPVSVTTATNLANYTVVGATGTNVTFISPSYLLLGLSSVPTNAFDVTVKNIAGLGGDVMAAPATLTAPTQPGGTIASGLVAYWSFDGHLLDSIDGFDGAARGKVPVGFTNGPTADFGKSLKLTGTNYVEIPGSSNKLQFANGSLSIAGWFKVESFDKSWQALIAKGENLNYRVARRSDTATNNAIAYAGGVGEGPNDVPQVNDGKWHHFVAVTDATGAKFGTALYLDGVIHGINTNKAVLQAGTSNLLIGENPEALNRQWTGEIDDIGLWNRVLSPEEIALLYNSGQGTPLSTLPGVISPVPAIRPYTIGLNFGADAVTNAAMAVLDVAGAVPQANWNNMNGQNGTNVTGIVADTDYEVAAPATVSVSFVSNGTWASTGRGEENNQFTGADRTLMTGYLDTGAPSTTLVTITNIPSQLTSSGYDVYVYAMGGVGGRGGGYRILTAGTTNVLKPYVRVQAPTNSSTYIEAPINPATTNYAVGNFMVFSNLNSAAITIEATTGNGLGFGGTPRAPINAIQLVAVGGEVTGPTVSIEVTPTGLSITFEGTLQSADQITGPWTDMTGASPITVTPTGTAKFYRSKQ